jgi:hypothetical protein
MNRLRIEESGRVNAPAAAVYRMIADYNEGHPRIIPEKYFSNMRVEKGGYGEGTVVLFDMTLFGRTQHARGIITEPEPGRLLVESYPDMDIVTTFTVDPIDGGASRVTIASDVPISGGVRGWIERKMIPGQLKKVFAEEIAQIGTVV